MSSFRYSDADRCLHCDQRAVIPRKADADAIVSHSGAALDALRCPVGNGWHLTYPAVEVGTED